MTSAPFEDESSVNTWSDAVDQACDRFEQEFRSSLRPQIEIFLQQFPADGREPLLRELIPLELELYRELGVRLSLPFYEMRFPDYAHVIREIEGDLFDGDEGSTVGIEQKPDKSTGPEKGHLVNQFQLQEVIGQGGFGTVWTAEDTRLQRQVAVKIPRRDRINGNDLSMFLREARASARLKHPHIVAVHEVSDGKDDSSAYIVTELINGPSLKVWLQKNKITPQQTASLIITLASALQHAHECGIVHRDVKPANVLMDERGQPHLVDFGLAKRDTIEESISRSGFLLGTPTYMAPEQATGQHETVDARTDIYALGVILYECLTGRPPFRGDLPWLLEQIENVPPAPPRHINPAVPVDLEQICLKCLAKDPKGRYQSAHHLAEDLSRYLNGETLQGIPIPIPRRIRKWAWRNRRPVGMVTGTALVCLILVAGLWWWNLPTIPKRVVLFTTDPPGCTITAVKLNDKTNDPDPQQIFHARGKTPLKLSLPTGNYLVVAVLDGQRFNEVFRKVPEDSPGPQVVEGKVHWKINPDKSVEYNGPIIIPRPDVSTGMSFIEGSVNWKVPSSSAAVYKNSVASVPAFFVDRNDAVVMTRESPEETAGPTGRFKEAEAEAERQGKRIPTAIEMLYLIDRKEHADTASEANQKELGLVQGLDTPPFEWTTTSPGIEIPWEIAAAKTGLTRVVLGGAKPLKLMLNTEEKVIYPSRVMQGHIFKNQVSLRCVRSVRPRTRPEDFVTVTPIPDEQESSPMPDPAKLPAKN